MKKNLSLKEKNGIAREADKNLRKWQQIGSIAYLYQGEELYYIKKDELYRYLGESPEYESWEFYLQSRHLDYRKAQYLIKIYSTFCLSFGFKPEELSDVHWTSLRALLPVAREENVQELVEKARNLTRTHLEMEVKALKNGLTDLGACKHPKVKEVHYYRCVFCGEHFKTPPEGSEIIKVQNRNEKPPDNRRVV